MLPRLLIALLFAALATPVAANSFIADARDLRMCTDLDATRPAEIHPAACRAARIGTIDPQGQMIWVVGTVNLPRDSPSAPIGFYLSGKMSSSVWWNGVWLGDNGRPGRDAATERAGRMDAVFYVPPGLARPGLNVIAIRLSAMHGFLHLDRPIHWIGAAPYAQPAHLALAGYWPSLITFGAFAAAALYFGAMAARRRDTTGSALLTAMVLFAGGQLLAEVARGLIAYTYPVHDLRLLAILVCSLGFGLSLFAYIWHRFARRWSWPALGAVGITAGMVALVVPGFDGKSTLAMMVPVAGGIVTTSWWACRRREAQAYLGALALFAALILWAPSAFLDRSFFFVVALLLGFLFVRQALAFVAEEDRRREETARAGRLEAALDRARQRDAPVRVPVLATGRTDFVAADSIAHCRGAGDYVELVLTGGAVMLHGGTLNELEALLPATFLRVHRSHIVNTKLVAALTRDPAGTGTLVLDNGDEVPVSRRIMPSVRSALAR